MEITYSFSAYRITWHTHFISLVQLAQASNSESVVILKLKQTIPPQYVVEHKSTHQCWMSYFFMHWNRAVTESLTLKLKELNIQIFIFATCCTKNTFRDHSVTEALVRPIQL